jgi:hypothetical protein
MVGAPAGTAWGRTARLAALPSRCAREHSSVRRNDPYWGRDIGNRPGDNWTDATRPGTDATLFPAECRLPRAKALEKISRIDAAPVLGAVEMHRTVSPAQVASVLGTSVTWAGRALRLLYAAGLVQGDLTRLRPGRRFTDLYRPLHPPGGRAEDEETRRFWESLPPADYCGVLGGRERRKEAISDRHAHLTCELLLRAAEHLPGVALVLGEMYARHCDFAVPGSRAAQSGKRGDGLIVRADGLHIVVETTASIARLGRAPDGKPRFSVSDKVRGWADLMLSGGNECCDMVVVFAEASRPGSDDAARTWRRLRQAVRQALHDRRYIEADVPGRFFIQQWKSWFPAEHAASEAFTLLSALSPATGAGGEKWARRDLLDPGSVPFAPSPSAAPVGEIVSDSGMFGVPYWLRGPGPDLEAIALREMGFDSVPVMPRVVPARQREAGGVWPSPVPLSAPRDARPRPLCARRAPYGSAA